MNQLEIIAHIETDFPEKFGIPRQSHLIPELTGKIIFTEKYRREEALRGLEDFSHIWLLWQFSENIRKDWSPSVRPPKLGGNTRMGVFATRSSFRPNNIGLSCVALDRIQIEEEPGPVLYVSGVDMMNGTPILDIKPYLPYADSHPDATGGFTDNLDIKELTVIIPKALLGRFSEKDFPPAKRLALRRVLAQDPRPSYQNDSDRIYGMEFAGMEVKFQVKDNILTVISIEKITDV